jgi:hypothetical protein
VVSAGTPEEASVNGWRTSSFSFANGNCVEVARTWRKASLSYANGSCAEVGARNGTVAVRDTTDRSGPVLRFTPDEWHAFLGGVRKGEFDGFGSGS